MPRRLEVFFHVHLGIAERGACFRTRQAHRRQQRRLGVHDAHAAAAAAAGGFDDYRILDRARRLDDLLGVLGQRPLRARHAGHTGLGHRHLGADLVSHQTNRVGARPDEHESTLLDLLREIRVFGQEAVTRMDRLCIGDFGRADDRRNVQVALRRWRRPDAYRLVGQAHVLRLGIGFRMHDDGLDAELATRTLDTQRDLTAVGDQHFVEQLSGALGCQGISL